MWSPTDTIPLPATVFTILRDLIHERAGVFFEPDKRSLLAEKLTGRLTELGFRDFLDYYYLLKYGPGADAEWPHLLDALSVPETYFWREIGQIDALTNVLLPAYVAAQPGKTIQIWSAACATGEEPLTIAMALQEAGWLERAPVKIVGSDASPAAIKKAQSGFYRERSFRSLPKFLRDKYFNPVAGGWQISPDLLSRVSFEHANLLNANDIAQRAACPFLFCRNVFLYFSPEAIALTVRRFAEKMERPGYLFVGASESLLRLNTDFELQSAGEAFVYQLKPAVQ
jgi:chemotaxis protein methyltransferase CheR